MRDGVQLATDVYLPERSGRRLPTVLVRLPYDKTGRYTFLPSIAARLTAHGFVAVVQDVRGKFRSEGDLVPFVNEALDGAATLDWIVAQPWSDGIVGMMGDSYYGFTQWAAASTGHPALRAIVPRVTGSQFFRMFSPQAVPKIPLFEWIVHTFSFSGAFERAPEDMVRGNQYRIPAAAQHVEALLEDLVRSNTEDLAEQRAFPDGVPAPTLQLPALHMGGWWDNLQRFQLDDWRSVSSSPAADHQYLRMGASDHEDFRLHEADDQHLDHETDDDALRDYLDVMMADPIDFFDHYLRGRPGAWPAPRVRYELTHVGWCVSDRWPPGESLPVRLTLHDLGRAVADRRGGVLSTSPCSSPDSVGWTHNPENPVPYLVESEWGQCADLPFEEVLHDRSDVLTLSTSPEAVAIDIVGHVSAELELESSSPSTHVIARLLDVYPDGRARLIVEGAAIAETGGGTVRASLDLGDTAYRLRPRHALRLAISSSCFPLYPVHPGTDADVWHPAHVACSDQVLRSAPAAPSLLVLSVLNGPWVGAR